MTGAAATGVGVPFVIYATPRSRTAWLSAFLSYRAWRCEHEQSVTMRSFDDMRAFFTQPQRGTIETGAAPAWRLIQHVCPPVRQVVLRRDIGEVMDSFRRLDVSAVAHYDFPRLERNLRYLDRILAKIAAQPGVMAIDHADLAREDAVAAVFEHCLPYKFDSAWFRAFRDVNIQVDVVAHLRYYHEHRDAIEGLKRELWGVQRRLFAAGQLKRAA